MQLSQIASKLKITCSPGASLAWEKQDDWQKRANGYRCTLSYRGRRMSLDFWQGSGIAGFPTVEGVLDAVLSDASTIDNASSFEDWCSELGFDADSRKAEKIYRASVRQTEKLKKLLGSEYETFLYAERDS